MARAVDLVVNPNNTAESYVLFDNAVVKPQGGAPMPRPNPLPIAIAYGDRAIWIQVTYWGDVDPVTGQKVPNTGSGYVGTALGQVHAYGSAVQPSENPVLSTGSGAGLYSCIGGIMDPNGNGSGWVVNHHGRLFRVLGPGGLAPTNMSAPTPNNGGAWDLLRAAHFHWPSGGTPRVILVNGRGRLYRSPSFAAVNSWPYYRNLDIIRDIEWNWTQDYGYMINGYGQIYGLSGAPSITSNRRFTTSRMTEMVILNWGLTGSAQSYRTLSTDGVTTDGLTTVPPRAYIVAPTGTNEVQRLLITGNPTGGSFRLSFNSEVSSIIPWNASADTIAGVLALMPSFQIGDVEVEEVAARTFNVTFTRRYTSENVSQLVLNTNSLTGGTTPTVSISTLTQGAIAVVTDTVRPEIRWVYFDSDSDVQSGVQVEVYPRGVTAGSPAMTIIPPGHRGGAKPWWITLIAGENVRGVVIPKRMPNGQWRAYLRASERNGVAGPWDFFDFDVNVVVPAAPTYAIAAVPALNAISLDFGNGLVGNRIVGVRRRPVNSYDVEDAWTTVRAFGPSSRVLISDGFDRADNNNLGSTPVVSSLGSIAWVYEDPTGAAMPIATGRAGGSAYAGAAYLPGPDKIEIDSVAITDVIFGGTTTAHHVTALMRYRSPSVCALAVRSHGNSTHQVRKTVNSITTVVGTYSGAIGTGASIAVVGTAVTLTVNGVARGIWDVPELAIEGALGIDGRAVGIATVGTGTRIGAFEAAQASVSVVDHEVTPGESYYYEGWYQSIDGGIEGPHAASQPVLAPIGPWWLKDPLAPSLNLALQVDDEELTIGNTETQGVLVVENSPYPVVISGVEQADLFQLVIAVPDSVTLNALVALRKPARTLFLQSRTGRSWYARLGPERPLAEAQADSAYGERLRTLTVDIIEVAPEPV